MAALPKYTPREGPEERRCGRILVAGVISSRGKVIDISASGARLHYGGTARIRTGDTIQLSILSDVTPPFGVTAQVIRTGRIGLFKHQVAVQFIDLTPEVSRLLTLIARDCSKGDVNWHI